MDNASNNSSFIQEIERIHQVEYDTVWDANEAQVACFPHTLNICVEQTIRALERLPLGPPNQDHSDKGGDNDDSNDDGDSDSDDDDSDSDDDGDSGDGDQRSVKSAIHKLRALVRGIRASDQRQTAFKDLISAGNSYGWWREDSDVAGEQGARIQITPKQLILDVRTRWSSTYLMLRRALELRDVSSNFIIISILFKWFCSR